MTLPPDDAGLLQRLRERDPIAPVELCERFLPLLLDDRRWVRGATRDEHLIEEAVHVALFDFIRRPHAYKPSLMPLLPYLRRAARGDLLNAISREQRHARRRAPLEAVELRPPAGNDQQSPPDLPGGVSRELLVRRLRAALPDPRDWEAMCLLIDGVRKTEPYADLYGLTDLPLAEQRIAVKRHKDRLKQRARRLGIRLRDE
jgi:DNA-directed RNA polymerase specialized sigma24 family protein